MNGKPFKSSKMKVWYIADRDGDPLDYIKGLESGYYRTEEEAEEAVRRFLKSTGDDDLTYRIKSIVDDVYPWDIVKESSMEKVDVIFKKTPDDGEIIAFFPETLRDGSCNPGNIMSYMHTGQHSEASIDFFRECEPASEEEYAELLTELERVYDDCHLVVKRRMH